VQFSNVFANLPAGTYTVSVTSGRACVATQIVTITQPTIIVVASPTVTQFGCTVGTNAPNFATIALSGVTGGSGIYNIYQFIRNGVVVQSGSATTYIDSNFEGATYSIKVFDDKGCSGTTTASVVINPFNAISNPQIVVNNAVTCTTREQITVSVTASSGTPSLSFNAIGLNGSIYNQTNNIGVFSGLTIGDYEITITNTFTSCSIKTIHSVNNPNTFAVNITNLSNVVCYGSNEGSVSISFVDLQPIPTNDVGAFTYEITGPTPSTGSSPNAGPFTVSNLSAGVYSVTATLTNSPFCPATFGFTVQQPDALLTVTASQTASVTCDNNKGIIVATANDGWQGAYEYALSGAANVSFSSNNVFDGLAAGDYSVSVRDSALCVQSTSITLVLPTPISATLVANVTLLACFGDTSGSVTVTSTAGGAGSGYIYTLNNLSAIPPTNSGPVTTNVFPNLVAGSYSVTVTDGYNCSFTTVPVTIAQPTKVVAALSVASPQTCFNQARITLTASGGTAPYRYSSDGITYTTATFNPSITFAVPIGTFSYFIKDANDCVSLRSNDVVIQVVPVLTADVSASNVVVNCFGGNTGSIIANASGGLGSYIYSVQNTITGVTTASQTTGIFPGLVAGSYQVNVTSADCTYRSNSIIITQPLSPLVFTASVTNVKCNGEGNGQIVINASGGTGIIKYAISPRLDRFLTTNIFNGLSPGNYDLIVQDENGCFSATNIAITEPTNLVSSLQGIVSQELCAGDLTAAFVVNVAGGTPPYSYSVDNINGPFTTGTASQTQFTIANQSGGNHFVYVRDRNDCATQRITVALNESVAINPLVQVNTFCPDEAIFNNVTVVVNAAVIGLVQFSLDGSLLLQGSNVFTNLAPGPHYINVIHRNGCTTPNQNFVIVAIAPLALNLVQGGLNEIVAIASGGNGGYSYSINGGASSSSSSFIIERTATYAVTVTDIKGCSRLANIPMVFVDIFIPNVFTPNGDGINDGWTPQNTVNYKNLVYYIFDRYGRKIATRTEGQRWDGTYNGEELPSGDYWYVIKVDGEASGSNREYVGNITLYR
jgi:gliding motility-associated-like protein